MTTGVFAEKVQVPRHRGDSRPKVLLPEHAGNATLAGKLLRYEQVPKDVSAYYTRATTFAGSVDDHSALERWMKRQTAIGVARTPALRKAIEIAAHQEDKKQLDKLCEEAMEVARSRDGATIGTAMHELTDMHDRGIPVDVADEDMRDDLAAYIKATQRLTMLSSEVFVVHDQYRIGGTFDRLVEHEGVRYIADLKTGSTMAYGTQTIAMQLAIYANSAVYDPTTAERSAHGASTTHGIIIHLPQGQGHCELLWLNIEAGWEAVKLAAQVRTWRRRSDLVQPMFLEAM